ncbi:MAG: hypothetical protein CFH10_00157 [Alphaproteobacteria bacterium MarineAlpha4_Bin2]|nr:MAG: hypothetical protein CFH10_00157 [Alphaproteobacteria bacterium MarineAlpha4_Bin2]
MTRAPKEQPPRNLSGERTVGGGHSGKRLRVLTVAHRRCKSASLMTLSGPRTERGGAIPGRDGTKNATSEGPNGTVFHAAECAKSHTTTRAP